MIFDLLFPLHFAPYQLKIVVSVTAWSISLILLSPTRLPCLVF